jgi:hypothetical protein
MPAPQIPPYAYPDYPDRVPYIRRHRGGLILVLGLIGIFVVFIPGVIAWVMGNNDLRAMDAREMDANGRGLTQAGRVLGMISTLMAIFVIATGILTAVVYSIAR